MSRLTRYTPYLVDEAAALYNSGAGNPYPF